jgi:hypothetical protein
MGHRDEFKPGDLAVRLSFARTMGNLGGNSVIPRLEVTDQTSGSTISIELTAEQITEMLAGGSAGVTADNVTGFKGLARWGKYQKITSRTVPVESGDYKFHETPLVLPHVMAAVRAIEAYGYEADTPRRNNAQQWVIVGRRYDDEPDEES